jgi:hypothetical protein
LISRRHRSAALIIPIIWAAGCGGSGEDQQDPPAVRLSNSEPAAGDAVRVVVVTRDRRVIDGANYHLTVKGPSGARCSGDATRALGLVTSEADEFGPDQETVEFVLYPSRSGRIFEETPGESWCTGAYAGAVDYRIPGVNTERHRLPSGISIYGPLIGEFVFTVQDE